MNKRHQRPDAFRVGAPPKDLLRRLRDWMQDLVFGSPEPAPVPVPVRVRR